jgi:predicted neutral ceramidase superfamily lipid hydrolase
VNPREDPIMARERVSYRNPLSSALLIAFLYLVVTSVFYWVFNDKLYFQDYHHFEWMEYVLGTIAMFVLVFLLEFVRNRMGRKRPPTSM